MDRNECIAACVIAICFTVAMMTMKHSTVSLVERW